MCDFGINIDDNMHVGHGLEGSIFDKPAPIFNTRSLSIFDDGCPFPSYECLRNVGFSESLVHHISEGDRHCYSDTEFHHLLYDSYDPVSAYNDMMKGKAQIAIDKADTLISDIEKNRLL